MNDKGQAVSEYVLIMVLFLGIYSTVMQYPPLAKAVSDLFYAVSALTDSYDLVLSLPFP